MPFLVNPVCHWSAPLHAPKSECGLQGPREGVKRALGAGRDEQDMTFLSAEVIEQLTGKKRPSAQARWLGRHKYTFERRSDRNRTIVLRQEEFDRHTLSKAIQPDKSWHVDLSQFAKTA
jgi:Domain of unknown function (DUF4224)